MTPNLALLQGRNGSGSGGAGPPSGGLPQLVVQEGGPGGSPPPGPDNADRADRSDRGGEGPTKAKCAPANEAEATSVNAAELAVPARPSAPVPPLGAAVPGTLLTVMAVFKDTSAMWHASSVHKDRFTQETRFNNFGSRQVAHGHGYFSKYAM